MSLSLASWRPRIERWWNPYAGVALTVVLLLVTEALHHVLPLPEPLPAALLLSTLFAVAYSSLTAGFRGGIACAVLVALYTLHFLGPHGVPATTDPEALTGGAVMLGISLAMAIPMGFVKRREDHLRRALRMRNDALEERNRELSESNAALEAFGYVVSHDLKEPVRAIENYLESAVEDFGTPESLRDVEEARRANQRLHRLLQGLLEYSRASSSVATPRPVPLAEVIQSEACRAQYEGVLRERGARLALDPALPVVLGDEVILCQLFGNLVLNAIKHNPSGAAEARVRAVPTAAPGRVHVLVEDNGPGFPRDVLERFRHLRGTRPSTLKGGFGLVISHRAAQRLEGHMWLENAPQGGGRVHVELPAPGGDPKAAGGADAPRQEDGPAARAEARPSAGRGLRTS